MSSVGGKGKEMGDFVGLYPSSDSEDEKSYRSRASTPPKATAARKSGATAHGDWSLFPVKEAPLAQPLASGVTGSAASLTPTSEKASSGSGKQNFRGGKKKKKIKAAAVVEKEEDKPTPSPLHAGVDNANGKDIEAACTTRTPSASRSAEEEASHEFELNKDRSPAEWMKVGDTTGVAFLWYTVMLQLGSAACSVVFLASHGENQLSWRTGCWGKWTSLSDAADIEFVEFDTHVGWQFYGKGDKLGNLSDVSRSAAVMGGLAGGMHTLVVFIAGTFLFFSLSALWLSYYRSCCAPRVSSADEEEQGEIEKPKRDGPLVLARDCHRWMFVMAGIDVLAGLWCFGIGCAGFYFIVINDFTDGIENLVSGWGESVSCATPETSPRYGFVINAVSVLLLLGGGIVSFQKTRVSNRELNEAVEMWEKDRAETAEMEARLAMIRKKEEYAAAAASAAASAAKSPATIFRSRKQGSAHGGGGASRRGSATSDMASVLPLSPPSPRSPNSSQTASSVAGPAERHNLDSSVANLSSLGANRSIPTASVGSTPSAVQSPDWDLESGSGAATAAGKSGSGTVDDDRPPPQGWEVRTTPSGERFWVNTLTKDVSWERPTV